MLLSTEADAPSLQGAQIDALKVVRVCACVRVHACACVRGWVGGGCSPRALSTVPLPLVIGPFPTPRCLLAWPTGPSAGPVPNCARLRVQVLDTDTGLGGYFAQGLSVSYLERTSRRLKRIVDVCCH